MAKQNKKPSARKSISKRIRFSVFARDQFTCRYCGRQSDEVKLVVDHVIPVAKGGTNDTVNLITSCEPCNQGKAEKQIDQFVPNEQDRLRLHQENKEQVALAAEAMRAVQADRELEQLVCNTFCEVFDRESMSKRTLRVLASYARQHGMNILVEWMRKARLIWWMVRASDDKIGRYISGIRKHELGEQEAAKCQ